MEIDRWLGRQPPPARPHLVMGRKGWTGDRLAPITETETGMVRHNGDSDNGGLIMIISPVLMTMNGECDRWAGGGDG